MVQLCNCTMSRLDLITPFIDMKIISDSALICRGISLRVIVKCETGCWECGIVLGIDEGANIVVK